MEALQQQYDSAVAAADGSARLSTLRARGGVAEAEAASASRRAS